MFVPGQMPFERDVEGAVRSQGLLQATGCTPARSVHLDMPLGRTGVLSVNLAFTEEGADGTLRSGFRVPSRDPYDVVGGILVVDVDDEDLFEARILDAELCLESQACRPLDAPVEIFLEQLATPVDVGSVGASEEWREVGTDTPLCEVGQR